MLCQRLVILPPLSLISTVAKPATKARPTAAAGSVALVDSNSVLALGTISVAASSSNTPDRIVRMRPQRVRFYVDQSSRENFSSCHFRGTFLHESLRAPRSVHRLRGNWPGPDLCNRRRSIRVHPDRNTSVRPAVCDEQTHPCGRPLRQHHQ